MDNEAELSTIFMWIVLKRFKYKVKYINSSKIPTGLKEIVVIWEFV